MMRIKKQKVQKVCLKFQDYQNCLEAAQIENKIKHLDKNKFDVDSPTEDENQ